MKLIAILLIVLFANVVCGQSYISYVTGNTQDTVSIPNGGVCMMGGATENDNAMRWFLERAAKGDILVLRASGSDGYNDYLFSELGVPVHSVETIVFNEASAAQDGYVRQRIQEAEGIWFAGGDQYKYVTYWRNSGIAELIRQALEQRNIVIGGTSAGMAILGEYYFAAANGTITSAEALNNPYHPAMDVDSSTFISHSLLGGVITDTHYDNPDRRGRHTAFLARILQDWGIQAKGIACEEYTAVCIEPDGRAKVYGDQPNDFAYFIQVNCSDVNVAPEEFSDNKPLTWRLNNNALKVYKIRGTSNGTGFFDIASWNNGEGGQWQNWYVENGNFVSTDGLVDNCILSNSEGRLETHVYPNPADDKIFVNSVVEGMPFRIIDMNGKVRMSDICSNHISIVGLEAGSYLLELISKDTTVRKVIIKK